MTYTGRSRLTRPAKFRERRTPDDVARHLTRRAKQGHDAIIAKRLIGTHAVELIERTLVGAASSSCMTRYLVQARSWSGAPHNFCALSP